MSHALSLPCALPSWLNSIAKTCVQQVTYRALLARSTPYVTLKIGLEQVLLLRVAKLEYLLMFKSLSSSSIRKIVLRLVVAVVGAADLINVARFPGNEMTMSTNLDDIFVENVAA